MDVLVIYQRVLETKYFKEVIKHPNFDNMELNENLT